MLVLRFVLAGASIAATAMAQTNAKILVHVTHGPEAPTRAALAFLVARTAAEEGRKVSIFLAGDAVKLLTSDSLDTIAGVGTGKIREHYDSLVKSGVRFYVSGMSAKARCLGEELIGNKPAGVRDAQCPTEALP
jgi:uncharacterized protein